jgi:hypothetical protein
MGESVSMWIPPAGSSDGSKNLLIVTPGRPLKALKVTSLLRETPSKTVPSALETKGRQSSGVKIGVTEGERTMYCTPRGSQEREREQEFSWH